MYREFYGLSEKPFETTPDTRFLYLTPRHREALLRLMEGFQQGQGLMLLVGAAGTGKTTLVHALLNTAEKKVKMIYLFHPVPTFKELLQRLAPGLGQEVAKGKSISLEHFKEVLDRFSGDQALGLVIDEAHKVPEKVMVELPALVNSKPNSIQILLVGQPEVEHKLAVPGLRSVADAIRVRAEIGALSQKESEEYIHHRLRVAGNDRTGPFTPDALRLITTRAEGIPRILNTLCDNAFIEGYRLSRKDIDPAIVRKVLYNMEGEAARAAPALPLTYTLRASKVRKLAILLLIAVLLGGAYFLTKEFRPQEWARLFLKSGDSAPSGKEGGSSRMGNEKNEGKRATDMVAQEPDGRTPSHASGPSRSSSALARSSILQPERDQITVERGENLFYIAQRYYRCADPLVVDLILDANPEIFDAHLVRIDQKIKLPAITEDSLILPMSDRTYTIHAATHLNSWKAKRYIEEAGLKGDRIEILPKKVSPRDDWYRVTIGGFAHRTEAEEMIQRLKARGFLVSVRRAAED